MSELTKVELTDLINRNRKRVLDGEEIPIEDQAAMVKLLRQGRMAAAEAATKSKSKSKKVTDEEADAVLDALLADTDTKGK
jgi:hypothetical protein